MVETLQLLFSRPASDPDTATVEYALDRLDVGDWRLLKLRALISGNYTALPLHNAEADDALLRAEFALATELSIHNATRRPLDVDALVVISEAAGRGPSDSAKHRLTGPQGDILDLLVTVKRKEDSAVKAASDLAKLASNMRAIRISGALVGHLARDWSEKPQVGNSAGTACFLSTPFVNPRHWEVLDPASALKLLDYCKATHSDQLITAVSMHQLNHESIPYEEIPIDIANELRLSSTLYWSDVEATLSLVRAARPGASDFWHRLAAKAEIHCLLELNQIDKAIKRTVAYCCDQYSSLKSYL